MLTLPKQKPGRAAPLELALTDQTIDMSIASAFSISLPATEFADADDDIRNQGKDENTSSIMAMDCKVSMTAR